MLDSLWHLILRKDKRLLHEDIRQKLLSHPEISTNQEGFQPSLTIITVTHNANATLEDTITSVAAQNYPEIEYIIIDNASTDGTVDIIKQHSEHISLWISAPDKGIYDAMNKALDKATGDWMYFLGADDILCSPETISDIFIDCYKPGFSARVISGHVIFTDGRLVRSSLGLRTLLHNTLHHQGTFYHRTLFANWRYDDSLKVLSDYELTLTIYCSKIPIEFINKKIARCGTEGVSSRKLWVAFKEMNNIRSRFLKPLPDALARILFGLKFTLFLMRRAFPFSSK